MSKFQPRTLKLKQIVTYQQSKHTAHVSLFRTEKQKEGGENLPERGERQIETEEEDERELKRSGTHEIVNLLLLPYVMLCNVTQLRLYRENLRLNLSWHYKCEDLHLLKSAFWSHY